MVYSHERHASSSSSSWSSLYGEFTIYQESTPDVCETVIPSDWKVDRGSERWPRLIAKSLRGDRRVYNVTKLLRLRMPKTCVFADSVLCLGSMRDRPVEARPSLSCFRSDAGGSRLVLSGTQARYACGLVSLYYRAVNRTSLSSLREKILLTFIIIWILLRSGGWFYLSVCVHKDRYGIEILIESLFRDGNSFLCSNCERN